MSGATKYLVLKIAFLGLHPCLLPHLAARDQSAHPGVFFPGRISHFTWISNMTLIPGNNAQEVLALLFSPSEWAGG